MIVKHGFSADDLNIISANWNIESVPEGRLDETIKYLIVNWGIEKKLFIDAEQALQDLKLLMLSSRSDRRFIKKDAILALLQKHGVSVSYKEHQNKQHDKPNALNIDFSRVAEDIEKKISLAESLVERGDYKNALSEYLKLADVIISEGLYYQCAAIFYYLSDSEKADAWCDKTLKLSPLYTKALILKGSIALDADDVDYALELFLTANDQEKNDSVTLCQIGSCFARMDKNQQAESFYREAVQADTNNAKARLSLAYTLYGNARFEEASEHSDKALLLSPGMPEALACKGEITRFYGNSEEALKYFDRAMKTQPDNKIAKLGQVLSLLEIGDSKGIVYLLDLYQDELRTLPAGKSLSIIDRRWNNLVSILVINYSDNKWLISYNGSETLSNKLGGDQIGLGVMRLKEVNIPVIFKIYDSLEGYNDAVRAFRSGCILGRYVTVSGRVDEHEDFAEIIITIKNHTIFGKTDKGTKKGILAFQKAFTDFASLHLIHGSSRQETAFQISGFELNSLT